MAQRGDNKIALFPKPCTLHPTPCTLHPAPCTLHPTPCTLHPTPYTLHPEHWTLNLNPKPYNLNQVKAVVRRSENKIALLNLETREGNTPLHYAATSSELHLKP